MRLKGGENSEENLNNLAETQNVSSSLLWCQPRSQGKHRFGNCHMHFCQCHRMLRIGTLQQKLSAKESRKVEFGKLSLGFLSTTIPQATQA
jgi:hypothetical protein